MKKEKVTCPACGTEFESPKKKPTAVAIVVGVGSGFGNACSCAIAQKETVKLPKTAQERIDALSAAGVDVSHLLALQGPNGGDYIASNKGGDLVFLKENDPIFNYIINQGTVPNRRLFRRFVMAQMFHMLSYTPHGQREPLGVTNMIHRLGYEYQWKMLVNELYAQMKMEGKDTENFTDRNRWFHAGIVVAMAEDYIEKLKLRVKDLPEKHCKSIPYKRIGSRDIFISDLQAKLYNPLTIAMRRITQAKNATQLYIAAKQFNDMRIKMASDTPQCKEWENAYKGSGAYFTMQNLIRFHNCIAFDDAGNKLDKFQSLAFISMKAELYSNGQGWKLLAVLKKMLDDNNINVMKKVTEWRKRK